MSRVRFDPMTPMFEWAKTVHDSVRGDTVIGRENFTFNSVVRAQGVYDTDK
jgi:hypothetical protein